jgi:hypothetical protein
MRFSPIDLEWASPHSDIDLSSLRGLVSAELSKDQIYHRSKVRESAALIYQKNKFFQFVRGNKINTSPNFLKDKFFSESIFLCDLCLNTSLNDITKPNPQEI